jgi:Raf kinase inhibitor-like YbhB/YbcL family protein
MFSTVFFYIQSAVFAQALPDGKFTLTSRDIAPDSSIAETYVFDGFGCQGQNLSPQLAWSNPPAGTRSFALMVHDPDAPTGGAGFWHWVVIDLPAKTRDLPRGSGAGDNSGLPEGTRQITTDFGTPGWGGPCPPAADKPHRYVFTLYALKVATLELPPNATASLTGFMINANALGKSSFTAYYDR